MTRVYTFANQKGGVGKTTTVVNLAACMADWGFRVLVVDVDPQSNATTSLGVNARGLMTSTYDVLLGTASLTEVIHLTAWRGLDLLPSAPSLAGVTVELNALPDPVTRALRLRESLAAAVAGYDYVLIDSPPSLGILTVNGLCAAQGVIVPVQCEYLALEGLSQLMHTIGLVQRGLNPNLELRGLALTMFDGRTTLSNEVVAEVRKFFPNRVFDILVPRSVRLSEAPSYGEPGVFYAPRSKGSLAYRILTWELLREDGHEVDWRPPATAED
ncbi:MAG: ParA family protein [Anaerolineae bacterium]|nr:ParA family protein [Anaerolineae bacterium]